MNQEIRIQYQWLFVIFIGGLFLQYFTNKYIPPCHSTTCAVCNCGGCWSARWHDLKLAWRWASPHALIRTYFFHYLISKAFSLVTCCGVFHTVAIGEKSCNVDIWTLATTCSMAFDGVWKCYEKWNRNKFVEFIFHFRFMMTRPGKKKKDKCLRIVIYT